jgi:excisionase family DNA binding protein
MASLDRPLPSEPLMTAKEAAAKLGISVKVLMQEVKAGRLRYVRIGIGKQRIIRRFTEYMLKTYIENQKVREVPACQSTSPKAQLFLKPTSKSTAVAFTSLSKPATKKKPSFLNGN